MEPRLQEDERLFSYLVLEFENSVAHYRHLEQQRSQYMAFYLTFLAATLGITVVLFRERELSEVSPVAVLGLIGIYLIASLIGLILLAAVKKLGFALSRHATKMNWVRARMTEGELFDHNTMCGEFDEEHPSVHSPIFNTQLGMEYVLTFLTLALTVSCFSILYVGQAATVFNPVTFWVGTFAVAGLLLSLLLVSHQRISEPQ